MRSNMASNVIISFQHNMVKMKPYLQNYNRMKAQVLTQKCLSYFHRPLIMVFVPKCIEYHGRKTRWRVQPVNNFKSRLQGLSCRKALSSTSSVIDPNTKFKGIWNTKSGQFWSRFVKHNCKTIKISKNTCLVELKNEKRFEKQFSQKTEIVFRRCAVSIYYSQSGFLRTNNEWKCFMDYVKNSSA